MSYKLQKMIRPDGTLNFKIKGLSFFKRAELHNLLLSLSWPVFVVLVFFIYLAINIIFTFLYFFSGTTGFSGSNTIAHSQLLIKIFYFSAQTLCTGYFTDTIPVSLRSTSLAAVEAVVGLFLFALITGLLYSRFAKPSAKILFSDNILIHPHKQGTAMFIRMANIKRNQLLKVNAEAILMMRIEQDGVQKNIFYDLVLEQQSIAMLLLTWTMVHVIDENSPLDLLTPEDIIAGNGEIIVVVEGSDDILSQSVFARASFTGHNILTGYQFQEITSVSKENVLTIDISKINLYKKLV